MHAGQNDDPIAVRTVLKATQDPASGAFMINRTADPNAQRTARQRGGDRPTILTHTPNQPLVP